MKKLLVIICMLSLFSCVSSNNPNEDTIVEKEIVVLVGDSITRGANPYNENNTGIKGYAPYLQEAFPDYDILNCGIGGETTEDILLRIDDISNGNYENCTLDTVDSETTMNFYDYSEYEGRKPSKILIMAGTNDVLQYFDYDYSLENYIEIINIIESKDIDAYISTIPPISRGDHNVDEINNIIEEVAFNLDIGLVDSNIALQDNWDNYTWDGIHLTQEGNIVLAEQWELLLREEEY